MWFLSFLLWFSPNSKSLHFQYDKAYYDRQTIADTVLSVIKAQDSAALEALFCKNIKDNTSDLQLRIKEIFDLTEGITSYEKDGSGADYDGSRGGKSILQKTCHIPYTEDSVEYRLFICWEVNNFSPAEAGIRQFSVSMWHGIEEGWKSIVSLNATEGVRNWHD